nr:MAG TPA: hypothetical protein [Caudoviricetes sp.]
MASMDISIAGNIIWSLCLLPLLWVGIEEDSILVFAG